MVLKLCWPFCVGGDLCTWEDVCCCHASVIRRTQSNIYQSVSTQIKVLDWHICLLGSWKSYFARKPLRAMLSLTSCSFWHTKNLSLYSRPKQTYLLSTSMEINFRPSNKNSHSVCTVPTRFSHNKQVLPAILQNCPNQTKMALVQGYF